MRGRGTAPVRYVVGAGALIALVNAVVAYRLSSPPTPAAGLYLFLLNLAYWSIWTLFAPAVLWLGTRVRFTDSGRVRAFVIHACSSVAFPAPHLPTLPPAPLPLRYCLFAL